MAVLYSTTCGEPCRHALDFPLTLPRDLPVHTPAQPSLCADCFALCAQSTKSKGGPHTITVEVLVVKGVPESYE